MSTKEEDVEIPETSKKKTKFERKIEKAPLNMKYLYQGLVQLSKFENEMKQLIDIKSGNVDMQAIKNSIWDQEATSCYKKIQRLGLANGTILCQSLQSPELMQEIAHNYNEVTRQCLDDKVDVIIYLSPNMVAIAFRIPQYDQVMIVNEVEALKKYVKKINKHKES